MLLDEKDSDVTFYVGDQKYPAHKAIVKTISPVFSEMLKHDTNEKSEVVINIPDCDPLVFRDFLSCVYTGKLDVNSKKNVCELYYISDKYNVGDLKMKCIDFMCNNLSVDIICDVIFLAVRHCEQNLLSRATEFFNDHVREIHLTIGYQNFIIEHPTESNDFLLKISSKISRK